MLPAFPALRAPCVTDNTTFYKRLARLVEGCAAWSFYGLFRLLPTSWCSALGANLGRYHGAESQIIASRIKKNLLRILPSISESDRLALSDNILKNAGRCYFETMILDRLLANDHVDTTPPEHIKKQITEGKPLILVTVHLANLGDLMIASLADLLLRQYSYEVGGSPTRKISNPCLSSLATHIRQRYLKGINGRGYDPDLKTARDFYRFLMKPRSVVLLHLDEAYDQQVHFPTFGRPLDRQGNVIKAIKLAAGTGALIQPVYLTRESTKPYFKVSWLPAFNVESDGTTLNEVSLMRYAQQLNELFEPRVFENLADWAQICYLRSEKTNLSEH